MTPDRVAVVGGGIAGLAAAWELQRRGLEFVVLEASPRCGGVIRTEAADGFVMEAGPDTLLAQKPEALALCFELGLGERLVPTNPDRKTLYVLHGGRLHALPEGMVLGVPTRLVPLAATRLFTWRGKLRMAAELLVPARPPAGDESIASFFRRRLGAEALARLGGPLLAGIHAGDPERLSIRATFPRLAEMETRRGSLIRAMLAATAPGPGPAFYSLRGGLGELAETLVARLPSERVRTRSEVRSLQRRQDVWALGLDGAEVRAQAVVLAVPAPRAAGLLRPLDAEAAGLLSGIRFASSAVVYLAYRRQDVRHALDGHGLVVAEGQALATKACSFVSTKFPGRAPAGHVLLRGFLGGIRDPEALGRDDAALADLVHCEMRPVLGLAASPVLARVYRWPSATPQMEVGHFARMAELEGRLRAFQGLALTGAGLRGTGIPDAIADGRRSATALVDGG